MMKTHSVIGAIGSVILSTIAAPAIAQNTQQFSTQEAVINDNNNQVIQVINQVNIGNRNQRNPDRGTTVQDTLQSVGVNGSNNVVIQESNQRNRHWFTNG